MCLVSTCLRVRDIRLGLACGGLLAGKAVLDTVDALLHEPEHLHNRVGKIFVMQIDRIDPLTLPDDHATGNSDDGAVRRHVVYDNGPTTHARSTAYRDVAKHRGPHSHDNAVVQGGMALAFLLAGSAQSHPLVQRDVFADNACLAYDHAHTVVDEETVTDAGTRMYLDTRPEAGTLRKESCEPFASAMPQPVIESVPPDRVESWIVEQDRHRRCRRRIAVSDRLYVLTNPREQCLKTFPWRLAYPFIANVHCILADSECFTQVRRAP